MLIRFLEMQGNGIVDTGSDVRLLEMPLQFSSVRDAYNIKVIDSAGPARFFWHN